MSRSRAFIVPIAASPNEDIFKKANHNFSGQIIVKQSDGKSFQIKKSQHVSWKKTQDELIQFRSILDNIDAAVRSCAASLIAAQGRKDIQEKMLSESPAIMIYHQPRRIDVADSLSDVFMQVCGYRTLHTALIGKEPGVITLGEANDGDSLVLRRGVHILSQPLILNTSIYIRRERSYVGGGGGGYSGGGGGGYGGGGGGGGGCYVSPIAQTVTINSGTKIKKGIVQVVGNLSHGKVIVNEPVFAESWEFSFSGECEEWIVPRRSMFVFEVYGAAAASVGNHEGGTGAVIEAYFSLEKDDKITMLVGGMSETYADEWGSCSGGGGGTFVFLNGSAFSNVLIVAGGGGGASFSSYSSGSSGQHASVETQGTFGSGAFCGSGGQDGMPGTARLISTCFAQPDGVSAFANHKKLKALIEKGESSFLGAGAGILGHAPGAATGFPLSDSKKISHFEFRGAASGGFGGGGCGELHPEEVIVRAIDTVAVLICKEGRPTVSGIHLEHHGRVKGSKAAPQCILVEGGRLGMQKSRISCEDGTGIHVVKSFVAKSNSETIGSIELECSCTISDCGGHGINISCGALNMKDTTIIKCNKDALHIHEKDTHAVLESCILKENGQHNIFATEGACIKAHSCVVENSKGSCCAAAGKGTSLSMIGCQIRHSEMSGVIFSEGARGELRSCQIYGHHDVGVLAQGNSSLQRKKFSRPEDETSAKVVNCNIKENGYGVWAQDGANISIMGGTISGSVHKDVNQHIANGITTAGALLNVGGIEMKVRATFLEWKRVAHIRVLIGSTLTGDRLAGFNAKMEAFVGTIDPNGTGICSRDKLTSSLDAFGVALDNIQVEQWLAYFDDDGNGTLNVLEFQEFFRDQQCKEYANIRGKITNVSNESFDDEICSSDGVLLVRSGYALFQKIWTNGGKVYLAESHSLSQGNEIQECIRIAPDESFESEQCLLSSFEKIYFRDTRNYSALSSALACVNDDDVLLLQKGLHIISQPWISSRSKILLQALQKMDDSTESIISILGSFSPFIVENGSLFLRNLIFETDDKATLEEMDWPIGERTSDLRIQKSDITTLRPSLLVKDGSLNLCSCSFNNVNCAVMVSGEGKVSSASCKISGGLHSRVGYLVCHGGLARIEGNAVEGCQFGICVVYGGSAEVNDCAFYKNRGVGLLAENGGMIVANNCSIIESFEFGLCCNGGGLLKATVCNVVRAQHSGASCSGENSKLDMDDSKIQESSLNGICVRSGGVLHLQKSIIFLNRGCGIFCTDKSTKVRVYGSKLQSNYQHGVSAENGADISLENSSELRQNGLCGARLMSNAIFRGFEVLVQQNGADGFLATDRSRAECSLSNITGNGISGLDVQDIGTKFSLYHCKCTNNKVGLNISSSSTFVMKQCLIQSNIHDQLSDKEQFSELELRRTPTNIVEVFQSEDVMPRILKPRKFSSRFGRPRNSSPSGAGVRDVTFKDSDRIETLPNDVIHPFRFPALVVPSAKARLNS